MKYAKSLLLAGTIALMAAGCQTSTQQAAGKAYPLQTCIVSDEKLGSMGDPIVKVYEGQEVKFCCKSCVGEFEKSPQKFLAKIK